jgi:nicotinamide-nucleotide amidase
MMPELSAAASSLLERARRRGWRLATAESCTGGMVAAALTDIAGSSDVLDRGWVTYSNQAKAEELSVPQDLLDRFGAVSEQVARAMAEGALAASGTDLAVAVTGIAGPGGGSAEKPVGLVHFATARRNGPTVAARHVFPGDRAQIRLASARTALAMLAAALI